jgi:signal transduction histidine kinase
LVEFLPAIAAKLRPSHHLQAHKWDIIAATRAQPEVAYVNSRLKGFRDGGKNLGVGLVGIRERVRELGGTLEIEATPSGTEVKASVPIAGAAAVA